MSGWIKIHRTIKDHWLYTEKRTFSKFEAWHDILIMVNFSDAKAIIKGKLYDIKRGQSILSLDSWGKRWNWDKSKVRRFLNALESDKMVVLLSDNITTRLTVCNYESYQGERNANETQKKRKLNTNEIQTTPIEEEEERKEEKKQLSKILFSDCNLFDRHIFKSEFPNWCKDKLIYYYEAALAYSNEGNKYINWKSAINTWARRDEAAGKLKFNIVIDPRNPKNLPIE